jgi:hypothetical protein
MNVNLHIDSIVLEGVDLGPGDDRLIQQIVSRELTTLLSTEGPSSSHRNGTNAEPIRGGTIRLGPSGTSSLSQQLAHSIHQGLGVASTPSMADVGGPR